MKYIILNSVIDSLHPGYRPNPFVWFNIFPKSNLLKLPRSQGIAFISRIGHFTEQEYYHFSTSNTPLNNKKAPHLEVFFLSTRIKNYFSFLTHLKGVPSCLTSIKRPVVVSRFTYCSVLGL